MRLPCFALCLLTGLLTANLVCYAQQSEETDEICVQGVSSAKRTLQATQRQAQRVVMSASAQVSSPCMPLHAHTSHRLKASTWR